MAIRDPHLRSTYPVCSTRIQKHRGVRRQILWFSTFEKMTPPQGWILCQKIEFWAPHPKKNKQSHFRILGAPPSIFGAPTLFFGPPMAFGALKSTLPPLLNAKLFRFGPLWNDFSDFLLFFLFFCKKIFFWWSGELLGPQKANFWRILHFIHPWFAPIPSPSFQDYNVITISNVVNLASRRSNGYLFKWLINHSWPWTLN